MDAMYLDPKNANPDLIGTMYECTTCQSHKLFEEGKTYLLTIEREGQAHYVFAWF